MGCDDLIEEQWERLMERIGAEVEYLSRLVARMQQLLFPPSDKLLKATISARDELQALWNTIHHLSQRHTTCAPLDPPEPRWITARRP